MIQASRHSLLRRSIATGSSIRAECVFPSAASFTANNTTTTKLPPSGYFNRRHFSSQILPQRTFLDTLYAGTKGIYSLVTSESSRQEFLKIINNNEVINSAVLKKARFGSLLTTALFHDLQNPLFHRYNFHPADFLMGVVPALQNFHDTIGRLQNQFPEVNSKEERAEKLMQRVQQLVVSASLQSGGRTNNNIDNNSSDGSTIPDNFWIHQQHDPESPAGQLKVMATTNVMDSMFLATEAASMLAKYQEGSAKVEYVALLSARAMVVDDYGVDEEEEQNIEQTTSDDAQRTATVEDESILQATKEAPAEGESKIPPTSDTLKSKVGGTAAPSGDDKQSTQTEENKSEEAATAKAVDDNITESDEAKTAASTSPENDDKTPVAAQIEVLYEMNQMVIPKAYSAMDLLGAMDAPEEDAEKKSEKEPEVEPRQEVQLWVGTFEGWLNGGPDGELRWRITRLRLPDAEFPDLYRA